MPEAFTVETDDGVLLAGEQAGKGPPVALLHGLTATRRYVVMGSSLLEREGASSICFDARGHGKSAPAPHASGYDYPRLAQDLRNVLDALSLQRAVLAGASMGAHTALRFALEEPERVAGLALITPAFDPRPDPQRDERAYASWDALARGLREGGVEGFIAAYHLDSLPQRWRATAEQVLRQRLSAHTHPLAVADALEAVPRSRPFEHAQELASIGAPTLVIGSRDEADPGHPLAVAERYAALIPRARLVVEEQGDPQPSPIAWQGGRVSRLLLELMEEAEPL